MLTALKHKGALKLCLTLCKVLSKEYAREDFDCYPMIQERYGSVSADKKSRCLATIRRRLRSIVDALTDGRNVATDMISKLEAWEADIKAGEEKSSRWEIPQFNEKLDEVLKTKVKMVNENSDFSASFVTVISPAHMAFERTVNSLMGKHKDNYDLKKDFLLKHKQYFQIWNKWLGPILGEHEKALRALEDRQDLAAIEAQIEAEEAAAVTPEEVPLQSSLQQ